MDHFEISNYLKNLDTNKRTGTCIGCEKTVQWAKERVASHKRSSCPNATQEEKRFFSKRKSESLIPTTSTQQVSSSIESSVETEKLTEELQNDIDMDVANFFFRTGISLRLVESVAFKKMLNSLNPSYKIPCAKKLSSVLLDKQFNKCSNVLDEILENSGNLTLVSDGWTNTRGDHIVNFCIKAPEHKPFFYTSINTSGIIQNATAVANAVFEVIESLGSQKFSAFVSDNAPVMKAAWKLIEEKFPNISAYGCAPHALNLLIKDMANTPECSKTIKNAEKIIKFVKNHHIVKAKFDEKRLATIGTVVVVITNADQ
ncbi:hypothetical protein PVAND_008000 [Polypedilum vanderplanki]|uniref:DUF659 domain-containing protein n=1 Tax=Polypedilum vanderplanki TaxID=319348 RepID=A0A9J6C961_POLVA|nr:hypothetical protein PVAND_008000 [Polypedilum vanderplanki]